MYSLEYSDIPGVFLFTSRRALFHCHQRSLLSDCVLTVTSVPHCYAVLVAYLVGYPTEDRHISLTS